MERSDIKAIDKRVIELIAQGMIVKDIALEVNVKHRTIKLHLSKLYKKLNISSDRIKQVSLVLWYMDPQPKDSGGRVYFNSRQLEVLELVTQGFKNKDIAAEIKTTEAMIKNYTRGLTELAGVDSRSMLAIWWKEHGREAKQYSKEYKNEKVKVWNGRNYTVFSVVVPA